LTVTNIDNGYGAHAPLRILRALIQRMKKSPAAGRLSLFWTAYFRSFFTASIEA